MDRSQWRPPNGRSLGHTFLGAVSLAALAAACTGNIGDGGRPGGSDDFFSDGDDGPGAGPQGELQPVPARLRRLLGRQYTNAVRDLLGDSAAAAASPPLDSALNGFDSIGAAELSFGDATVSEYESSARGVAAAAMGDTDRIEELLGCAPAGPQDAECHASFVARLGRQAFRRPLTDEEIASYTAVATLAATELGDFHAGVEWALSGMLQSPHFLYQVEIGKPAPDDPSVRRLDGYELATKMSFFLLDTTPSVALLDAAEAGALDTPEGVRSAARDLIEESGARTAVNELYSELLRLGELDGLSKHADTYPQFNPDLAQSMKEETLRLIEEVVWERDADIRELYTADYTFVDPALAELYGAQAPASGEFERVSLPTEQGRRGLLGQASFLSLFAHLSTTSPTLRGRFIRERLLCQSIPAPPNDVVTVLPEDPEAKTMRDKLEQHRTDPSCSGCHILMDGVGLSLEQFDGVGAYRTTENGETIDVSGDLDGTGFVGPAELASLLGESEAAASCVVRSVFRHALGHVETQGEEPAIAELERAFAGSGHRLRELYVELVASEAFQLVGVEP